MAAGSRKAGARDQFGREQAEFCAVDEYVDVVLIQFALTWKGLGIHVEYQQQQITHVQGHFGLFLPVCQSVKT